MTTASIPELRKAHTRTRAQLTRAAVRYGKRALARRGSGEDGPPSDQEVALLRELLAAAEAMTAAAREHRAAANWQPQQQPWAGVTGANPDPLSRLWWAAFGWTRPKLLGIRRRPSRLGRHCRRRRSLSSNVDRTGGGRAGKAADDAGNRLGLSPAASSQIRGEPHCGAERRRGARGPKSAVAVPILQPGEGNAGEPGLAHEDDGTAGP